ncbi:MAG TPA: hypothetical protein VFM02_04190 [Candidatus Paceibacterota bacterium]|nr:hypothetical protein [Candidatus Paceibacterota bacterium]
MMKLASSPLHFRGMPMGFYENAPWRMLEQPFAVSGQTLEELKKFSLAYFLFSDAVHRLSDGGNEMVKTLVRHKLPKGFLAKSGKSLSRRLRFDLVLRNDGNFFLTEAESAPGGEGFTQVFQELYGVFPTIADDMKEYLDGRPYRILMAPEWTGDCLVEQLILVKALRERGVDAKLLVMHSPENLDRALMGTRFWQNPVPPFETIRSLGLLEGAEFCEELPEKLPPSTVVFRMMYYRDVTKEILYRLSEWEKQGVVFSNGLHYVYENKAMLACLAVPAIRERLEKSHSLEILERHIAKTELVFCGVSDISSQYRRQRELVLKAAAHTPKSEGAREVFVGTNETQVEWEAKIGRSMGAEYPCVVQQLVKGGSWDIRHFERDGSDNLMRGAKIRWTPFVTLVVRGCGCREISVSPGMATFRKSDVVHGHLDAVMGPVVVQ